MWWFAQLNAYGWNKFFLKIHAPLNEFPYNGPNNVDSLELNQIPR